MVQSKTPKITNFGLWDFKKFFVEHTVPNDVIFLNPHQAPEVTLIKKKIQISSYMKKSRRERLQSHI
jgi:hypothetical protein